MPCNPVDPSGTGGASFAVCTSPSLSVARTLISWLPDDASQSYDHCSQVSAVTALASTASAQSPSSTRTSTRDTPVCCAQATPATVTRPADTESPPCGVSMRDDSLIGPRADQPRVVQ